LKKACKLKSGEEGGMFLAKIAPQLRLRRHFLEAEVFLLQNLMIGLSKFQSKLGAG
jgi:hypothetical protein